MIKNVFVTVLVAVFVTSQLMGQMTETKPDTLIIYADVENNSVNINWHSLTPEAWNEYDSLGYTVKRTEIDQIGGSLIGNEIALGSNTILPNSPKWFEDHKYDLNGLMEPIGALVYDSSFVFPENDILDEVSMKFNYLVNESVLHNDVARAIGLGILDSTAVESKYYRYTITPLLTSIPYSIDVQIKKGLEYKTPKGIDVKFNFPNDLSLSDMQRLAYPPKDERIVAIARSYGDSIVVRWGPSSAELWNKANVDGYQISRYAPLIKQDTIIGIIKPWARTQINESIQNDSMAMMAAGILFSDQKDYGDNLQERAANFENRHGFALYAAERSPTAADLLGLRIVDRNVEPGLFYEYSITTKSLPDFKRGYVALVNELNVVPAPFGVRSESLDKAIKIIWDKSNENSFNSYILEKSLDGTNFEPVSKEPLVFAENERFPLEYFHFVDSVDVNYKKIYYNLKGYDSFGELSDEISLSAMAVDLTPPPKPELNDIIYNAEYNNFDFSWNCKQAVPKDFEHASLFKGDKLDGEFQVVSNQFKANDTYILQMDAEADMDRAFYFKLAYQDTSGNQSYSLPKFVEVPDLFAPEPPSNIIGIIDSTGKVNVAWEHSIAKDVEGYWLYWSNGVDDEMTPVNGKPITTNNHSWYIEDYSLTQDIYITVRAEDDANNRGNTAKIIKVKRPDKVPPIRAFMIAPTIDDNKLIVHWKRSGSDDLKEQLLLKRYTYGKEALSDTAWIIIDTLDSYSTSYIDKIIPFEEMAQYCIISIDEAGNRSKKSNIKNAKIPFPNDIAVVEELKTSSKKSDDKTVAILNWSFDPEIQKLKEEQHNFEIYRSIGNHTPEYLNKVSSTDMEYIDEDIEKSVLYNYSVKVIYDKFWKGNMSKVKSIIVR